MAVHFSHAALPFPIRKARFTIAVPYLDADGDPTDPTTPDTEISKDAGAFADCAEEVTTISGSNGTGYITFSGAEMDCALAAIAAKVASGPKNTLATVYPRDLPIISSGTLSAGSAGGGTLGTVLAYDVTGVFVRTTGGTGGGGTGGANNQARRVMTYNTGTGAFTVTPNWETTPDNTTTYDLLAPEGVTLAMLKALNPTTAGSTLDVSGGIGKGDVRQWNGTNVATPDTAGYPKVTIKSGTGAGELSITSGIVGAALSAAERLAIWDIATSLLTTVGSIGKRLADFITGDAYVRLGAPAGASTAADIAAVKTDTAAIKTKTDNLPADPADESNTQAKLDTIIGYIDTEVGTLITQLTGARAELGSVPAANATLGQKVDWLFMCSRNKRTSTSSQDKVYADDTSTVVGTAALSDDATTFSKGEYA